MWLYKQHRYPSIRWMSTRYRSSMAEHYVSTGSLLTVGKSSNFFFQINFQLIFNWILEGMESGMKPKLAGHVITCHSWISTSRMALGTKAGQILIMEEADIVTQIPLDANDPRAARIHHDR